jgi:hypothetical protein
MQQSKSNFPKAFLLTLICAIGIGGTAPAQTASDLVAQGRTFLSQRYLINANAKFAAAVATSPSHEEANFFYAGTRLMTLVNQSATQDFLDRLGFAAIGRDIYNWNSKPARDAFGRRITPAGVNAQEGTAHLKSTLRPELQAARANLAKVTSPGFEIALTASETTTASVSIDIADVSLLIALTHFLEYFLYTTDSWNLNAILTDLDALHQSNQLNAERILSDYPELFTYRSTDDLADARDQFSDFVTTYQLASSSIRSRAVQDNHLFMDDPARSIEEMDFRSLIQDLKNSLAQGPIALSINNKYTVNATPHFNSMHSLRSYLPQMRKNSFVIGSLPDETFGGVITGLSAEQIEAFAIENKVESLPSLSTGQLAPGMMIGSQFFNFPINVIKGRGYVVQYSDNLRDWQNIEFVIASSGRVVISDFMEQAQPQRFYRILESAGFPPENDNFSNRIVLTGLPTTTGGANANATRESGEPDHTDESFGQGNRSVWWSWTSPINGNVTISTSGSPFDTLLGVYTGNTASSLAVIAQNDQDPQGGNDSRVSLTTTAGTIYQIAVDGYFSSTGNITLNISSPWWTGLPTGD